MKKERSSNIEILRILCMLAIIMHHCVIHGGAIGIENSTNKIIALLVLPAGKICFDCFVAISAWFMVDSTFKANRFFKVWLEVLFYNVVFVGMTALLGNGFGATPITWREWLGAFFPIIGNSHGFAASYIAYYLLTPFLAMISRQLTQKSAGWLVGLLFGIQVFSKIMGSIVHYSQPMPSEVLLFVLFYFVAFYLKNWTPSILKRKGVLWTILLLCYSVVVCAWIGANYYPQYAPTWSFLIQNAGDESCLPNVLAGIAMLLIVKDIKIPTIPFINKLATTTLGVLLIHDHNYFRPVVWNRFVKASSWYYVSPKHFLFNLVLSAIAIFAIGAVIDLLRQAILEKPILHSNLLKNCCNRINCFFQVTEERGERSDLPKMCVKRNEKIQTGVTVFLLVTTLLFFVVMFLTRGAIIDQFFVSDHNDTAMDFFNMLANILVGDPYYAQANYPAMNFFLLKVLYRFIASTVMEPQYNGFFLRNFMPAQLLYIGFMLICSLLIWEMLRYFSKGMGWKSVLFALSIMICGPMLFLYERGNLLILCLAATLVFLGCYDSENTYVRFIAYIALAFAASMKIYPAVFGFLIVKKGRVKEAFLLVFLGIVFFIAPFFEFDGISSLRAMLGGITASAEVQLGQGLGTNYSGDNLYKIFGLLLGKQVSDAPTWFIFFLALLCGAAFVTSREEWKKLLSLTLLSLWVPKFSYTYCLVFLILPLISILFRNKSRWTWKTSVFAFAIAGTLLLHCTPNVRVESVVYSDIYLKFPITYGMIAVNFILLFLGIAVLIDNLVTPLFYNGKYHTRDEYKKAR